MYPFYLSLYAFYQRNMRNILFIFFFSFLLRAVVAQTGDTGYTFLRYPSSARANAMGGNTMSLVERDPSLIFHNPALLGAEMDQMVNLNYLNYISDINVGSALFTKAYKEKGAWVWEPRSSVRERYGECRKKVFRREILRQRTSV